jgi:hypothetical protein
MQTMPVRIFLVLFILALIYPSSLIAARIQPSPEIKKESPTPPEVPKTNAGQRESAEVMPGLSSAPERRTALVIGNSTYSTGPLKNPVNDASDMASTLQKLGFKVVLKKNANLETMEEAIEDFGNRLKRGGVGLFYYAGHGVQVNGINYLIPIGAKINKESDVRFKAFDAGRVLAEMENANNGLNIVLLDACRDNPFGKSFRSASRGLAIVSSAPAGTFISYSTSPGQVAIDGEDRNSPYTKALLQYAQEPGLTIEDVFKGVRQKLRKETGQVPWELSSLEGKFYFRPGAAKMATDVNAPGKTVTDRDESSVSKPSATDELDDESRKLNDEEIKLEKERALLEKKKAIEEKRQKIEEEKAAWEAKKSMTLGMARPPEVKKNGRFIDNGNGTVTDTKTSLMWAARDKETHTNWVDGPNGKILSTSWAKARSYCENYRGGGYTDWRMPTQEELAGLYDNAKTYKTECQTEVHLTEMIHLTCEWIWASETRGLDPGQPCLSYESCPGSAALFGFGYTGSRHWDHQYYDGGTRALPVRSGK